ncbi:MAG TPA: hypothetical protein VLA52_14375 [Thermohalobaculum sp.]|nr:hypothetical protein [Thermohalobaculum sp.]
MLKASGTSAGIIGMVAGSAIAGPMLMGDGDLDTIVAGKKTQSTDGTGIDSKGDE